MKCNKIRDRLSLYLTDELPDKEYLDITMHIKECQICQKELSELKTIFGLLNQVKPIIKFPYPSDDFLPQVRRRLKNQTILSSKRRLLPKLIPAFSSALVIIITIVLFNIFSHKEVQYPVTIFNSLSEENNVVDYMDNLDENSQNLVAEQVVNVISDSDLIAFDSELNSSLATDELVSDLNEIEQEIFINQILTQYKQAQDNINPEWVNINPGGENG